MNTSNTPPTEHLALTAIIAMKAFVEAPLDQLLTSIEGRLRESLDMGGTPLSPEQFQQEINDGVRMGMRTEHQVASLAKHRDDLEGLKLGTVSPRRVAGKNGTKKMAREWLTSQVNDHENALRTGGFCYPANLGNYDLYLNRLVKEQKTALQ